MKLFLPLALMSATGCASIDYVVHDDTNPEVVDTGERDTGTTIDTGDTSVIDPEIPTLLVDRAGFVKNCLHPNPEDYAFRDADGGIDPGSLSLLQERLGIRATEVLSLINASSGCEGTTEEMLSTGNLPANCDVFLVSVKEGYPNGGYSWGEGCRINGEQTWMYAFFGQEAHDFLAMDSTADGLYGVSCDSMRIDSFVDESSTLAPLYLSFGTGNLGSPESFGCSHNGYGEVWDFSRYDDSSAGETCDFADSLGDANGTVQINFTAACESGSTECSASTTQSSMDEAAKWLMNTADELLDTNPNEDFRCWGQLGFAEVDWE